MSSHAIAGRYSLQREIGRGGAGAVWLAVDGVLERQVALKRVGLPPAAEHAELERAEREARLSARVAHPNVVAVLDFVAGREEYWLVMEYVAGRNLGQLIRKQGPMPPPEVAELLAQATDGLAAAHARGIVHRDVKPSNILVGEDGVVKLTDFGIARGAGDASLTQTGLVTGSPAYLAPEVATGGSATTASDVWSVGATLYHALAGVAPYHREGEASGNALATLHRIANEPPPRLETEGWASDLLAATMEPDPRRRPSAAEVARLLHDASSGTTTTRVMPVAPPPSPRAHRKSFWRRPGLLAGAAALLLAVVLVAGLLLTSVEDGAPGEASPDGDAAGTTSPTDAATAASASELEEFARSYVATASTDPDRGFAMLTEEYRAASPRYHEFWSGVRNPRILQVTGDPDGLQVSYTYEYSVAGQGRRREDVVLQLVQRDGELLIAGDATP